jgi:putative membrane protein
MRQWIVAAAALAALCVAAGPAAPLTDEQFVAVAASGGMFEVESSKLAAERSQNDKVKQFAKTMIDDHAKIGEQLADLAKSRNFALPQRMMPSHMQMLERLCGATGGAFDAAFAEAQVKAHEAAAEVFRAQSRNGRDAQLQDFAAKTLPKLEEHLRMAHQLTDTKPTIPPAKE